MIKILLKNNRIIRKKDEIYKNFSIKNFPLTTNNQ